MSMTAITSQISWVYSEDIDASFRFYEVALGLALERDAGSARIYRTAKGARIGVCGVFGDRVAAPAGSMITLITDDVDGWYRALKARGVALKGPPEVLERFNIYSFFVTDPAGYVIEIQSFL